MSFFDRLQSWYDERRELQQQTEWRRGFLTGVAHREFPNLPPVATEREIAESSQAFRSGHHYGMNCSLAIGSPDDRKTPRVKTQ